jgi:hypothetical protein
VHRARAQALPVDANHKHMVEGWAESCERKFKITFEGHNDAQRATEQRAAHFREPLFQTGPVHDGIGEMLARQGKPLKLPRAIYRDVIADDDGCITERQVRLVAKRVRAALIALATLSLPPPASSPPSPPAALATAFAALNAVAAARMTAPAPDLVAARTT